MKSEEQDIERLYACVYRIRRAEEEMARLYPTDKIKSPIHLSIGQEAVAVGVCESLRKEDVVFGTYRGHAFYLAKGGDLKRMVAELYGKDTGCARGKGGSMHLIDVENGFQGTSAIVATVIPQAVGYAYTLKLRRSDNIVVSVFGDGATEEGAFHESLNFAALKKLPVLFVCENNHYAVFTPITSRQAVDNIHERAAVYGIPSQRIESGDVLEIAEKTRVAIAAIRRGEGPQFIECDTYRWREHVGPNEDWGAGYRSEDEARKWVDSDPVTRLGDLVEPSRRSALEKEVELEIGEAVAFGEDSPFPAASELFTDVFAE